MVTVCGEGNIASPLCTPAMPTYSSRTLEMFQVNNRSCHDCKIDRRIRRPIFHPRSRVHDPRGIFRILRKPLDSRGKQRRMASSGFVGPVATEKLIACENAIGVGPFDDFVGVAAWRGAEGNLDF